MLRAAHPRLPGMQERLVLKEVQMPHVFSVVSCSGHARCAQSLAGQGNWALDRTRSCRHLVVTAADGQRRKFRGDTPTLHPGIQGPGC